MNAGMSWDEYANRAPINDETIDAEPVQRARTNKILDRCVGKTLDVGGGDGHISKALLDRGHEVTMTEASRVRVDRAIALGIDARLRDSLRWYGDQMYDTVLLGEVLEHCDDPGRLLRDAFNIARERVIISLPLNGWPDPTHQWRISLDHYSEPSPHSDGRHTPQEQIVLTFQRGPCWPPNYHETDEKWQQQFEDGH